MADKLCIDCKHAEKSCPINQRLEPGQPCACYETKFPASRGTTHGGLMQMQMLSEHEKFQVELLEHEEKCQRMDDIKNAPVQATTIKTLDALATQIGGCHYKKMAIQPMEYSMANKLDACQHTIIKYVSRFRTKGGVQDLEKAKHCIDMLIAFEKKEGK